MADQLDYVSIECPKPPIRVEDYDASSIVIAMTPVEASIYGISATNNPNLKMLPVPPYNAPRLGELLSLVEWARSASKPILVIGSIYDCSRAGLTAAAILVALKGVNYLEALAMIASRGIRLATLPQLTVLEAFSRLYSTELGSRLKDVEDSVLECTLLVAPRLKISVKEALDFCNTINRIADYRLAGVRLVARDTLELIFWIPRGAWPQGKGYSNVCGRVLSEIKLSNYRVACIEKPIEEPPPAY